MDANPIGTPVACGLPSRWRGDVAPTSRVHYHLLDDEHRKVS